MDAGFVTGMTDAETQAGKVLASRFRDRVTQAIMSTVTAAAFQPGRTGRQVEFVMDHEDLANLDFIETGDGGDCLTTEIHERIRFQQPDIFTIDARFCSLTVKFAFRTQIGMHCMRKFIYKPEPGIMPGLLVFGAGITETSDKFNGSCTHTVEAAGSERKLFRGLSTLGWRLCFGLFFATTARLVDADNGKVIFRTV